MEKLTPQIKKYKGDWKDEKGFNTRKEADDFINNKKKEGNELNGKRNKNRNTT